MAKQRHIAQVKANRKSGTKPLDNKAMARKAEGEKKQPASQHQAERGQQAMGRAHTAGQGPSSAEVLAPLSMKAVAKDYQVKLEGLEEAVVPDAHRQHTAENLDEDMDEDTSSASLDQEEFANWVGQQVKHQESGFTMVDINEAGIAVSAIEPPQQQGQGSNKSQKTTKTRRSMARAPTRSRARTLMRRCSKQPWR